MKERNKYSDYPTNEHVLGTYHGDIYTDPSFICNKNVDFGFSNPFYLITQD